MGDAGSFMSWLSDLVNHLSESCKVIGKDGTMGRMKFLKENGIIDSGRLGYKITPKGMQFFRRWRDEWETKIDDLALSS